MHNVDLRSAAGATEARISKCTSQNSYLFSFSLIGEEGAIKAKVCVRVNLANNLTFLKEILFC